MSVLRIRVAVQEVYIQGNKLVEFCIWEEAVEIVTTPPTVLSYTNLEKCVLSSKSQN